MAFVANNCLATTVYLSYSVNTNGAPRTLASRIVEGVGASLSEGEGVDEDEDVGVGEGRTENEFRF